MKIFKFFAIAVLVAGFCCFIADDSFARGRTGSSRVGGYSSHGKGSHYVGGH